MAGAQYRAKALAALAKKPYVNAVMDEDCCGGRNDFIEAQDMGISNFVYIIAVPMQVDVAALNPEAFACVAEPKRWIKFKLPGDQIVAYCDGLIAMLDKEPAHRQNRVRNLDIEAQIAPRNPHMFAIASDVMMFVKMKAKTERETLEALKKTCTAENLHILKPLQELVTRGPPEVVSAGATTKFSYFYLKTPEGDSQYDNRKRLARLIVMFLLREFCSVQEVLDRGWLEFYSSKYVTGTDKQDDYADAFLIMYTEECARRRIRPTWIALGRLYAFLQTDVHFREDGSWPLALTAEGLRQHDIAERALAREQERAKRKQDKEAQAQQARKRKLPEAEASKRLGDLRDKIEDAQTNAAAFASLDSIHRAANNHKTHKKARPAQRAAEKEERKKTDAQSRLATSQLLHKELTPQELAQVESGGSSMQYLAQREFLAVRRADQARLANAVELIDLEREDVREERSELQKKMIREAKARGEEIPEVERLMMEECN